jgi:beta-lactamase class A
MTTRRQFLLGTLGAVVTPLAEASAARRRLATIESGVGGRVGVFALDTGNGRQLACRPDERFAMCSTFKWVLAAAVLVAAERAQLALDDQLAYTASDLLAYAPTTRAHAAEGSMSVAALAEAAVTVSDNTAANLLLAKIGGPPALTQLARSLGDNASRFDRTEPDLNSNEPGDPRDTTTPRAMVGLMQQILCGSALSLASRDRLLGWLRECETGKDRLRAGLPKEWIVGDKTGTGRRGAANDVAIAFPPDRAPILIAAYLSDGPAEIPHLAAAHASIANVVSREF